MKKFILSAIVIFIVQISFAQTDTTNQESRETEIFTIIETMPSWKGCEKKKSEEARNQCTYNKMQEFLAKNLNYPITLYDEGIIGTVYVTFIINELGEVDKASVSHGVHEDMDNEALRVILKQPKWNPGIQKGKAVKVQYNLPIRFTLR